MWLRLNADGTPLLTTNPEDETGAVVKSRVGSKVVSERSGSGTTLRRMAPPLDHSTDMRGLSRHSDPSVYSALECILIVDWRRKIWGWQWWQVGPSLLEGTCSWRRDYPIELHLGRYNIPASFCGPIRWSLGRYNIPVRVHPSCIPRHTIIRLDLRRKDMATYYHPHIHPNISSTDQSINVQVMMKNAISNCTWCL